MPLIQRFDVAKKLVDTGVLPIYTNDNIDTIKQVIDACYIGGIRVFELTNRGLAAHETFSVVRKYVYEKYPDMLIGAGTIVDAPTAALYIQLGANFIVSPILAEEMAFVCNRRKVLWIPGCATVTEISRAEELGADIVKLFPAKEIGGASFVKNVKAPLPWSNLLITGGVELSEESFSTWFNAGACCLGMGSKLFDKATIDKGEYSVVEKNIAEAIRVVGQVR